MGILDWPEDVANAAIDWGNDSEYLVALLAMPTISGPVSAYLIAKALSSEPARDSIFYGNPENFTDPSTWGAFDIERYTNPDNWNGYGYDMWLGG